MPEALTTKRESACTVIKMLSRELPAWAGCSLTTSYWSIAFPPAASEEVTGYVGNYSKVVYHITLYWVNLPCGSSQVPALYSAPGRSTTESLCTKRSKQTHFNVSVSCNLRGRIQHHIYSPKTRHTRLRFSMVASLLVEPRWQSPRYPRYSFTAYRGKTRDAMTLECHWNKSGYKSFVWTSRLTELWQKKYIIYIQISNLIYY